MNRQDILNILKVGANFEIDEKEYGFGSINNFPECNLEDPENGMTLGWYKTVHYPQKARLLESLPWNIVQDPHNPKSEEYPTEEGIYITMMDCNEHEVCTNMFHDGHFSWMNRTHIKWWMKLPEE